MSLFKKLWIFISKLWGGSTTTTTTTSTKGIPSTPNKKALCIGINNYPGTGSDLNGCVNDAKGWEAMGNSHGFGIKLLLDAQATIPKVITALEKLITEAVAGDELLVTYSGHGSNVADQNGDEADGRDETWYLYDGNLRDDKIRKILNKLPAGVKLTIISDSCHSGSVTRALLGAVSDESYCKARYMPPEDDIEAIAMSSLPINKSIAYPEEGMNHVLISGCKSTEYSYDASFNGRAMGAFSHNALLILRDNPNITYKDFYTKIQKKLPSSRYPQTPQLEGSKENKNQKFFL